MFQIDIYVGYNSIFLLLLLWDSTFPEITSERCLRVLDIGVVRYSGEVFYNAQCILTCILKSKECIWESEIVFSRNFLWVIMKQYLFLRPTDLLFHKFTMLEFTWCTWWLLTDAQSFELLLNVLGSIYVMIRMPSVKLSFGVRFKVLCDI